MEMNVATVHSAVVRSVPSNAVFTPSSGAALYQNNVESRSRVVSLTLQHRVSPVHFTTTTTTTIGGLSWLHPTAASVSTSSYDNCKVTTTTTTTTTTTSGSEVDCPANHNAPHVANTDTCRQTCAACGQEIVDRFLLQAIERYWHTGCLRCSACHAPLDELGSTCFTRAGMTLCRNDYIR